MAHDPLKTILSKIADLERIAEMYKEDGMTTNEMAALIAELRQSAEALEEEMAATSR